MGVVGGALMARQLNKIVGNVMGYNGIFGANGLNPFGSPAPASTPTAPSSSGGKGGLTSMLGGGSNSLNPPEDPLSLGPASEYSPLQPSSQGKAGTQPSWNAGLTDKWAGPIADPVRAGPDLRQFSRDYMLDK